ncbi:MAG: hypothetical protein B7733_07195 [Myxococcales bacterium FL481]|nr:MAG: hypothetical protein B7733_07195 [Myxococcales bacterium FL481]
MGSAAQGQLAGAVRAVRTLDCASKLRIHYFAACGVGRSFLAQFPPDLVVVHAFSKRVQGARDHFVVDRPDVHISGVIGGNRIVVTFRKTAATEHDVAAFESQLLAAGLGTRIEQISPIG